MTVLSGADIVGRDGIVSSGTLVVRDGRIAEVRAGSTPNGPLTGHLIVPGFVDIHIHGASGIDLLDGDEGVARLAGALPQSGVTAFCPTTIACAPADLARILQQVRRLRAEPPAGGARVLPAHLESNFINPAYSGAQPRGCIRNAAPAAGPRARAAAGVAPAPDPFSAADILAVIDDYAPDIAIVTLAPEIEGGLDLVRRFAQAGIRVSLGHSAASYDEAMSAFDAGARHATHLFNRMPPLHHRAPGLAGAALQRTDVVVELICDGCHVHDALVRVTVAAKGPAHVAAISDGTAIAGLPSGAGGTLGAQVIESRDGAARLADGTLAGSALTMDAAFARLVGPLGFSPVDAAAMCATTPARALGLSNYGYIAEGAAADVVVLSPAGAVAQTWVGGRLVYARGAHA